MPIPSFLKNKQEKENESNKDDFREKCQQILFQIKEISQEKFHELNKTFCNTYSKENIKKTMLVGFYGQLINELKTLKAHFIPDKIEQFANDAKEFVKQTETKISRKIDELKEEAKKIVKPVAKKKVVKKAAKKTVKKAAKKVVKKTVTKKVAKKTAKKKKK